MKKFYTVLLITFSIVGNAQNLVANPTFADGLTGWTAGPTASYTLPAIISGDGSDDKNSVQYIPTATTGFYQEIPIVGGSQLEISFYYKASGDDKDARIWSWYRDATNTNIYQAGDASAGIENDPLRTNNGYLATATVWTIKTITVTAPANATKLVLAFRAYVAGTVSFDQISVVQTVPLSVRQNSIDGLNVYPNPARNGNVFITSNNSATKTIAIYDILGKQVLSGKTDNNAVNVSALRSGTYIIRISEEGKTATKKLIIE